MFVTLFRRPVDFLIASGAAVRAQACQKSIIAGEQYSSIYKDTRELAKVTVQMVDAIMSGKEVQVNDTKTYNNEVKVVPSFLLTPYAVGKGDIKKALVESGYYTQEQIDN